MIESFCTSVAPSTDLPPCEWMGQNVRLQNSDRSEFLDVRQTPWWREPIDLAADNTVHEIVVLAPTGAGKSTIAEGLSCYIPAEDPGPFLYASQTDPDAKFFVESRAQKAMKSCAPLKPLWPKDKSNSRKLEIIWPHMPMVFGGANHSNFQEKSVRWGYGDEVWSWKHGLVQEFLGRSHDRWNRRFYLVSQGGEKDGELDQEWEKTDMAEWSWKCPECGSRQAYERKQLKFNWIKDAEGALDHQASADTARMCCPSCESEFADTPLNRRMLTDSAKYVSKKSGLNGYRGFHVHALAIHWVPWARYVLFLLAAKAQLDLGDVTKWRQLRQKRDALPWSDDMAVDKTELTVSEIKPDEIKEDPKTRLPGETHRFMTVDKGGDHFWAMIRSWKPGGPVEMLFEGYIPGKGGDEPELKALQERFAVDSKYVFVDMSFEWEETAQLCADNGWTGIKGEGEIQSFKYSPRKGESVERMFSKFQYATGSRGGKARYVRIATNPLKDILWRLLNGKGIRYNVLSNVSKAYKKHIKAEVRKSVPTGKRKHLSHHWEQIHKNNHLWDCEVYQIAAGQMCGQFNDSPDPEN